MVTKQKSLSLLVTFLFILMFSSSSFAMTVDLYQDCESGSNGDVLTGEIMSASSNGLGDWTAYNGTMWVSTNHAKSLPGTVTVGTMTYSDTGTRTWVVNDKNSINSVCLRVGAWPGLSVSKVTLGCYLTPSVTSYVYNGWDLIVIEGNNTYVVLTLWRGTADPPSLGCHSHDDSWKSTVSDSRVSIVPGKTYWINLAFNGDTHECLAAVFDPDTWTQVGSTASCYAYGTSINLSYIKFGRADNHGDNPTAGTQTYYDNIMIDYTDPPFPLLPDISLDTTSPTAPSVVRDGTGTDMSSTTLTNQLSANWDAASDPESSISRYEYAIGTAPGATNVTNAWLTNGMNLTVTKTGLTLIVGTTYYFSVRAVNGSGLTGSVTNSNGQYVAVSISTGECDGCTPPSAPPAVRDGTGLDMDSTLLTAQLSANWDASTDPESGVAKYWYAIGTTPGASDKVGWTDNGTVTTVTQTGLTLTVGTTYYFSVKAENGVGLQSSTTTSNGQYVIVASTITPPPPRPAEGIKAYPNPCDFKAGSKMQFAISGNVGGTVKIYTMNGILVREVRGEMGAGEIPWDGTNEDGEKVVKGIYIYKITENNEDTITGKLAIR